LRFGRQKSRRELNRQTKPRFTAASIGAIYQSELAAVSFGNLPAENESDAGASLFGGKEGNK
jgi:hypothetical protein